MTVILLKKNVNAQPFEIHMSKLVERILEEILVGDKYVIQIKLVFRASLCK